MPPQPPIRGLQAAFSSCRISITRTSAPSAIAASSSWRAAFFSTTPSAAQPVPVPPESPKYITIPEPPQASEEKLPPVRGHLPVPRDVFPAREGNRKVKAGYVESIMPLSAAEKAGEPPKSEREERHRRMAAARRSALAAGLQGLYVRKTQREQRLARRAEANRRANLAAATAPERPEDVLTRPSVRLSTSDNVTVSPPENRFENAEKARRRHEQKLAREAEARGDALAQLYVAAQDFIVDEAELAQRVDEIFTPDYHRGGWDRGESIWDVYRSPVSINDLRAEMAGQSHNMLTATKATTTKTAERQKQVAEELTGGKLV